MKIPNIAAVSELGAAFSYGAKKSSEIADPILNPGQMFNNLNKNAILDI